MTRVLNLTYLTGSGLTARWDPEFDENPFGGLSRLAGRVRNEGPHGLRWTEICDDGRQRPHERWFGSRVYACPTPKRDGIVLQIWCADDGTPFDGGLVLNADGSLRWEVHPPAIVSDTLALGIAVQLRGQKGSALSDCNLEQDGGPYVYWHVMFPEPAFSWAELREYDPDTNTFTDRGMGTRRD